MRFPFASLTCAAAMFLIAATASAQTATLRYRWAKGDVIPYRVTLQGSSTMTGVPGMGEMVVDQMVVQGLRLTVDDVAADGAVTLRQTFESLRMEVNSPGGKIAFDSTAPAKADDPMTAAIAGPMLAMVGESITMVMLPTGKVSKVEGMARIFDKVLARMPDNPVAAQMLNQFKAGMSDEATQATFQQGFGTFADRAVKVGESWNDEQKTNHPMLGGMATSATFTLASIDGAAGASVARVNFKLKTAYTPNAAPSGPASVVVKAADSSSDGELLFDISNGRVQKTVTRTQTPMTMTMQGPDGSPVTIQNQVKSTMTLEMVAKQ